MSQPDFFWLSMAASPPARWNLRLLDWRIGGRCLDWADMAERRHSIVVGVEEAQARADLIRNGFADALPSQVALVELAARMVKLEGLRKMIPSHRRVGPLRLDLFHRDDQADGRWIGLHPREFALMWRLAECPGE